MKRCFQNTGFGWWKESQTAETIRTPVGGDSMKANLVIEVHTNDMLVTEVAHGEDDRVRGGG